MNQLEVFLRTARVEAARNILGMPNLVFGIVPGRRMTPGRERQVVEEMVAALLILRSVQGR